MPCTDPGELSLLPEHQVHYTAEIFKALSDPTRLQIITLLMDHELCVHDLTILLELTQPAISHHLRILRQLQLVTYRKEGRHVIYKLDDSHVYELLKHALDHIQHA